MARRIISLLSQAPLVLTDADGRFYRRFLRSLARENPLPALHHARASPTACRACWCRSRCVTPRCASPTRRAISSSAREALSDELQRQILPDGGHISRNPQALIDIMLDLLPLRQTFAARNIAPPPALLNAIDRIMPMLRFFRHGDGNFALFNGMGPTPSDLLATLLAYDDARGAPIASMPHSGFQRLDGGAPRSSWTPASRRRSVSQDAHAGCLSFELSAGPCRIIANCGMPATGRDNWRALRAKPRRIRPHLSRYVVVPVRGVTADEALPARRADHRRPAQVEVHRETTADGMLITASHDGYAEQFRADPSPRR